MKIIYATDLYLPKDFGGNRQAWEVTAALAQKGHDVRVVTGAIGPLSAPPGVEVVRYPVSRRTPLHTFLSNALGTWRAMRREARRLAPDVILFQSADGALLPVAEGIARNQPTAFVYVARFESAAMDRIAEGLVETLPSLKAIRTAPNRFAQLVERFVLRHVNAVFAVSDTAAAEAKTVTGSGGPPVYTVRPGIDTGSFTPGNKNAARRILDIPPAAIVILVVGRLARVKRYDKAIAATAELTRRDPRRRYLLIVVGDGPEAPSLKSIATAADADVRFEGYLDADELRYRYWAADVQLCTSDSETLGFSLIEGLASALPVIGVPNGAAKWLGQVDPSFILLNSEPQTIADGVHGVLSSQRLGDLQRRARRYAVENWDWQVVIGDIEWRVEELTGFTAAQRS